MVRAKGYSKKSLSSKKAVIGIETLIIFIAMILVAAIAAGVLIRTSGVLQQKALAVADESIARVSTGIEVIQINANANTSDGSGSTKQIEILARLASGSDPIKMQDLGLSYTSGETFLSAELSHPDSTLQVTDTITLLTNTSTVEVQNLDLDVDDNDPDTVTLLFNHSGDYEGLQFDLTTAGIVNVSLGVNLENATELTVRNIPIQNEGEENIYGYITLTGDLATTIGSAINTTLDSQNLTFTINNYPTTCKFETLRPDVDFCFVKRLGDTDMNFEPNEILTFYYKLSDEYKLYPDTRVEISLIPTKAIISTTIFFTPEVFSTYKVLMWP